MPIVYHSLNVRQGFDTINSHGIDRSILPVQLDERSRFLLAVYLRHTPAHTLEELAGGGDVPGDGGDHKSANDGLHILRRNRGEHRGPELSHTASVRIPGASAVACREPA
jgi:hypothetical protein